MQHIRQRKTRRGWEHFARTPLRAAIAAVVTLSGAFVPGSLKAQKQATSSRQPPLSHTSPEPSPASIEHHFDIPAGSLLPAINLFRQQSGMILDVALTADKLSLFHTAGVLGDLSSQAALTQLLQNSGLSCSFAGENQAEIGIHHSEQVDVTSSVASVGLQQFPAPLLDTPQSVSVVPQFIMQDQATTTLRDSLRNVPGISMAAGEGGSQGDNLTIRGFNARNDIFLDGIRDFGSYYRDSFDYENIDVLEGPAGVEFGRGSTGGVVNQETKEPQVHEFAHGTAQFGTNEMRRVTLDVNQPLTNFGGGTAFRVNLVATQSMIAERDITKTRRFGIATALESGMNTSTRFQLQYLHESEDSTPDYGLPYFGPSVAAVDRRTYYGFAADNYLRTSPDVLTAKLEHDFTQHLTARNLLRWANYPRNVRITEPQINTSATLAAPASIGAPASATCTKTSIPASSCYALGTPLSHVSVKRNELNARSSEDMLWDQLSAIGRYSILSIPNNIVFILEGGRERSDPDRNGYTMPYVPALDPNPYDPFQPTTSYPGVRTYVASQSFGIGFNDSLDLRQWLLLSGGVRFDYFNTNSHAAANPLAASPTSAFDVSRLDKQPTCRAAVVIKPQPQGSVYFDWGTSFDPSAESLSLSANNATAPPEENETYELGGKWNYFHEQLNLSGSIFRTRKDNAHETDPNNSNNILTVGTYIVRGLQLGALGHLPANFDLELGYALLQGYLQNSALNASPFNAINIALIALKDPRANTGPFYISPDHFPIANVPRNTANLWLTHRILNSFIAGFGLNYTGARRASSSALIGVYSSSAPADVTQVPLVAKAIPGYCILSAMLRHPVTDRIDFQANLENLTNKFYIDEPHPNHLVPGEGLNAQFGLNYKF